MAGAISDGLISRADGSDSPGNCAHTVALVMAPGYDYHWYRLDDDGMWSHKPGGTAARNVDSANNLITNPQTAARGPYTVFCGFFTVNNCEVRIDGPYEEQREIEIQLDIFSGRPNPTWTVAGEAAEHLWRLLRRLEADAAEGASRPRLPRVPAYGSCARRCERTTGVSRSCPHAASNRRTTEIPVESKRLSSGRRGNSVMER